MPVYHISCKGVSTSIYISPLSHIFSVYIISILMYFTHLHSTPVFLSFHFFPPTNIAHTFTHSSGTPIPINSKLHKQLFFLYPPLPSSVFIITDSTYTSSVIRALIPRSTIDTTIFSTENLDNISHCRL